MTALKMNEAEPREAAIGRAWRPWTLNARASTAGVVSIAVRVR